MTVTPSEFLEVLAFWKNQAETIIREGKLVIPYEEGDAEIGWDDILLDMEDYARSTTIVEISEEAKQRAAHTMKLK